MTEDELPAELDEVAAPEVIEEDEVVEDADGDTTDDEDLEADEDEDVGEGEEEDE